MSRDFTCVTCTKYTRVYIRLRYAYIPTGVSTGVDQEKKKIKKYPNLLSRSDVSQNRTELKKFDHVFSFFFFFFFSGLFASHIIPKKEWFVNPIRSDISPRESMSRSRYWCFTINNYTQEVEDRISGLRSIVDYLIYGREVAESGTPHLQGFVSFPSRKTLNQVRVYLEGGHCTIARFVTASITYCKKDGDFTEFGTEPDVTQGKRNDLESAKEDIQNGMTNMDDLMEHHSSVFARYPKFVDKYVRKYKQTYEVTCHPLRAWQVTLNQKLNREPDNRTITFLVDMEGNCGKSWFFSYYHQNHRDTTQIILPGKKADMALILLEHLRVLFVDAPRSKQGDFIQYDFLEEVKNGRVFSSKYESRMKVFKPPHVVVAMNEFPKMDMLSEDRYDVVNITRADNLVVEEQRQEQQTNSVVENLESVEDEDANAASAS